MIKKLLKFNELVLIEEFSANGEPNVIIIVMKKKHIQQQK